MSALHKKRHGFSLIELLVVIAIIAILMGITGGAMFRIRAANQRKNNDITLSKINTLLDSRLKIIREDVKAAKIKDPKLWAAAMTTAGNNAEAAESLLLYAKLKNELPMTVTEAKTAVTVGSIVLQPRPVFSGLVAAGTEQEQSAVCLYIALTTSGSGGTSTDIEGLQGQVTSPIIGGTQQKVFTDVWGQPIAFARHAYHPELNAVPYIRAGSLVDPLNPSGKANSYLSTYWITNNSKPGLRDYTPAWANFPPTYNPQANHVPTAISSGPDRQWGSDMFGGDNQVSFRLRREGNRAD